VDLDTQFVEAEIAGKTLDNVFVIPRSALREDRQVLIIDDAGTLQIRDVKVEWKDADVAVISEGLKPGEVLNTTSLGSVTNGRQRGDKPSGKGKPDADSPGQNGEMTRFKSMIDEGKDLPPVVVESIQKRIDAGEEVPAWLKQYIEKAAK